MAKGYKISFATIRPAFLEVMGSLCILAAHIPVKLSARIKNPTENSAIDISVKKTKTKANRSNI